MAEFLHQGEGIIIIKHDQRETMIQAIHSFNTQNSGGDPDQRYLQEYEENMWLLCAGFFDNRGLPGKILSLEGERNIRIPIDYNLFPDFSYFNALSIEAIRRLGNPNEIDILAFRTTRYLEQIASSF